MALRLDRINRTWLMLFVAIVMCTLTLFRQVRSETPGARLSLRFVRNFLVLSLPPARQSPSWPYSP